MMNCVTYYYYEIKLQCTVMEYNLIVILKSKN